MAVQSGLDGDVLTRGNVTQCAPRRGKPSRLFGEQRGCDAVEGAVGFAECEAAIVAVSAGDVLGAVESGADVGKVVRGDSPFAQWRV
jgi:hypothetical protein